MQQRRVRLGDILDDYCPRERRVTNHAVVAMIEDDVKQTRCTTCDTEHEYKHAKVPAPRRKKTALPAHGILAEASTADPQLVADEAADELTDAASLATESVESAAGAGAETESGSESESESESDQAVALAEPGDVEDEWPVHRRLIRATLPRPEGQAPERKAPDFTIRQNGGRFEGQRNGNRARHKARHGQAHGHGSGQSRFGNSHSGNQSRHGQPSGHPQRHGNRQGPPSGQRSHGHGGGQKPGHGRGPKRGR